jgi:arylsulfatase A
MNRKSKETGLSVCPVLRNDKVIKLIEPVGQSDITREYTEETIAFIRRNKDRTFFVYMAHTAVRVPVYPGKDFAGKSKNGRYGDWVEELDWTSSAVIDALTAFKLEKNTLSLFTSDNRPWLCEAGRECVR